MWRFVGRKLFDDVKNIGAVINIDGRQTLREIAEAMNYSKSTVHRVLSDDLKVSRESGRHVGCHAYWTMHEAFNTQVRKNDTDVQFDIDVTLNNDTTCACRRYVAMLIIAEKSLQSYIIQRLHKTDV